MIRKNIFRRGIGKKLPVVGFKLTEESFINKYIKCYSYGKR